MPEIRNVDAGDDRQLLVEAARRVIADQWTTLPRMKATVRVGHAKAHRLIDLLTKAGVVGLAAVDGKRRALVGRDQSAAAIAVLSEELTEVSHG